MATRLYAQSTVDLVMSVENMTTEGTQRRKYDDGGKQRQRRKYDESRKGNDVEENDDDDVVEQGRQRLLLRTSKLSVKAVHNISETATALNM